MAEAPPATIVGLKVNDETGTFDAGLTVSVAVCVLVLYEAVSVTTCVEETLPVKIENVVWVRPAGTVAVAGTDAAEGLLLLRLMVASVDGAGPDKVMVPFAPVPLVTAVGLTVNDEIVGGEPAVTVRVPCTLLLAEAVIVTLVDEVTPEFVRTRTRTLFIPDSMVAVLGTVAALVLPLDRLMVLLPAGATALATVITFAVELLPPAAVEGFSVKEPSENEAGDVPVVFFM